MVQQRLCYSLYALGRRRDAGESLLKMVNTLDEECYMSGSFIKWISGEFLFNKFGCRAFETSPQILRTDISLLPKVTVTRPRTQANTMKRRHLLQPPIHALPHCS